MRTRQEIVDKIEEMYSLAKENKLDMLKVIIMADALCWVLGDDYLDFEYMQRVCENGNN
nr:MAG TPA: hypothetical protein [Bacteriophage sp.]